MDVPLVVLYGTSSHHGHCWVHVATDVMDIRSIFGMVPTGHAETNLSIGHEVYICYNFICQFSS
ncbi:hypothetical protein AHAS_Ahas18G0162200 [Arachis hypogaea]